VTYVGAIMFVVTLVGASLTIALIFATTVLSLKWWKPFAIHGIKKRSNSQLNINREQTYANKKAISGSLKTTTTINSDIQIKTKSKSQTLVQFKRISSLNELVNKKVKTCEMLDIGHVVSIDKQAMTVLRESKQQQYVIPTYFIREYNQEYVVTDISIRYLYHYKAEQEFQSF
jgi:hypothetical protein